MADAALVGCLMSLHGALLLCQGMAFSVAMNSKRSHALVALLIASNFMEIKGADTACPCAYLAAPNLHSCQFYENKIR